MSDEARPAFKDRPVLDSLLDEGSPASFPVAYRSQQAYEDVRIRAAAVYCSDGRMGDQVDEFLHLGLELPRYDRLACPGGPVGLAGRLTAFWETRDVEEQLRFLVRAHEVGQVVLLTHQGCAYYRHRLGIPEDRALAEQLADLEKAAAAVERIDPRLEVAGFLVTVADERVVFSRVFATKGMDARLGRPPARPGAGRGAPAASDRSRR
jgi:hypothetical protein